jgi:WD40 repeat protein
MVAYVRPEGEGYAMYARPVQSDGPEVKVVGLEDVRYIDDQVAWSPDGKQFVVPLQVGEKSQVLSFDPQTGELRQLPIPALDVTTALAPNGSAVIFGLPVDWLLVTLGGAQGTIDRASAGATCTDWSRDGETLLCVGSEGLTTLRIATGEVEKLLEGDIQTAVWSPDGTRAAFVRDQRLGVLDIATGQVKMIVPDMTAMYETNAYGLGYLAWSPDGKRIAFGDWRVEEPVTQGRSDIYVVDADGDNLRRLTDSPRAKRDFAFSPDGKYVAYLHSLDDGDHLEVVDAQTGAEQPVDMVTWSPPRWLGTDAILGNGYQGIAAARLDGSVQLLVAATRGCRLSLIGWANGRLFFSETCTHQGL